jgi:hypothetical protein
MEKAFDNTFGELSGAQDYVKETLSCYSSVLARVQGDHINFKHLWIDFTLKQTP